MSFRVTFNVQKRVCFSLQTFSILIGWLFLCLLHWDNDGLWFGDAPYHTANGIFWKDYLLNLSFDPKGYALSYFARYPVIAPTKYPPMFYILEAVSFGVFGQSPYIAKFLVLVFTLMLALFTAAWCRRWIADEAGWAGLLIILLPGVVRWSHTIMLNIPALAFSIGALYYFRRWLESSPTSITWQYLYYAAILTVLSILTYLTSSVLIFICGIWLLVEKRWYLLWNLRTLVVIVTSTLLLLPWLIVVLKFESNRVHMVTDHITYETFTAYSYLRWALLYYPKCFPELFGIHILIIAALGIGCSIFDKRWRHETILMFIIMLVCLSYFIYIPEKEDRYILILSLPIVCFCLMFLLSIFQILNKLTKITSKLTKLMKFTVLLTFLICQTWLASRVYVPSVSGFKKVVAYLEKFASEEPVFYDGIYSHIFTFYVQAIDPDFRLQVVLGRKFLYAESPFGKTQEFISSPQEAVNMLQKRIGCKWVVVCDNGIPMTEASLHLRKALMWPQFEQVKSFPIIRTRLDSTEQRLNISIYRVLMPIEQIDEIDMPFFSLGKNARYRIKPIQR